MRFLHEIWRRQTNVTGNSREIYTSFKHIALLSNPKRLKSLIFDSFNLKLLPNLAVKLLL